MEEERRVVGERTREWERRCGDKREEQMRELIYAVESNWRRVCHPYSKECG